MKSATVILFFITFVSQQFLFAQEQYKLPSQEIIKEYWYQKGAEISSFNLKQHRYNETRQGYLVNVFVTEPFQKNKQVKADDPNAIDATPALKLNQIKKFNTGIYQYSTMTSVFSPFESKGDRPFKLTTSVQEWCGHIFTQLNKNEKGYDLKSFSYFESEGDKEKSLDVIILEDGIWNQIRLNPNELKQGEFEALPSTTYLRLMHKEAKPYKAKAELIVLEKTSTYKIKFSELNRTNEIEFENTFPFKITKFKESYPGMHSDDKIFKTTGEVVKTINSFYWQKNHNKDSYLQKELSLDILLK